MSTATKDLGHEHSAATNCSASRSVVRNAGFLAEFKTEAGILTAASKTREAGYQKWDVHTPYPLHGMDDAMGIQATKLPWMVLGAGLLGLCLATLMQWWMNAVDYRFMISGKPMWSLPANVPVMFEVMVLFSGLTAFFGSMGLNRMPQFYRPQFRSERFRRATDDRFFIWIDREDAKFHDAEAFLGTLDACHIEVVREELDAT